MHDALATAALPPPSPAGPPACWQARLLDFQHCPPHPEWVYPVSASILISIWLLIAAGYRRGYRHASGLSNLGRMRAPRPIEGVFDVTSTCQCNGLAGVNNRRRANLLLAWRAANLAAFLYAESTEWVHGVSNDDYRFLLYYTVWTFHLQIVYWAAATTLSYRVLYHGGSVAPRQLQGHAWLVRTLQGMCLPIAIFVSICAWDVLAQHEQKLKETDDLQTPLGYMHTAVNTGCFMVEFALGRHEVHLEAMLAAESWALLYCFFTWGQHVFSGSWPYFFFEPTPFSPVWMTFVALGHAAAVLLIVGASRFKRHWLRQPAKPSTTPTPQGSSGTLPEPLLHSPQRSPRSDAYSPRSNFGSEAGPSLSPVPESLYPSPQPSGRALSQDAVQPRERVGCP